VSPPPWSIKCPHTRLTAPAAYSPEITDPSGRSTRACSSWRGTPVVPAIPGHVCVVEHRPGRQCWAVGVARQVGEQRAQPIVHLEAGLVGEPASAGVEQHVARAEEVDRDGRCEFRNLHAEPAEEAWHVP
jgi:hypothetical protein